MTKRTSDRARSSLQIMTLTFGTLTLAACSALPPEQVTPSAGQSSGEVETETIAACSMMSIVETTTNNAGAGAVLGNLTAAEAATIINTIPHMLVVVKEVSNGLPKELTNLIAAVAETPPLVAGTTFNPDGLPYRDSFQEIRDVCKENGVEVIVIPNYPGG